MTYPVDCFGDLLGGFRSEDVYYNMPIRVLPGLNVGWRVDGLRRMDIVPAIGAEDPFLGSNSHLSKVLCTEGIWHALHVWDGRAHQGRHCRKMAPLYV